MPDSHKWLPMRKPTREAGATRRPSRSGRSPRADAGASRPTGPRGSYPAHAHSEVWTLGDLMDYAREQGYSIELTKLTDEVRRG